MRRILEQPGNISQWQALVAEAEELSGVQLGEELESYLVFTLMRYLRRPDMAQRILALFGLVSPSCRAPPRAGQLLRQAGA